MREFICMEETTAQTQKVIRQWLSTGYTIEFVSQTACYTEFDSGSIRVVTSLFRTKAE